jgi:hypothetical protein
LREDQGRTVKDYKLISIEGNVLKAEQNFNQTQIPALCHPLPVGATLKGLLALQIHPCHAQAVHLDAAFLYPVELLFKST